MRRLLIALAASVSLAGTAAATDNSDVMALVHQWANAFNDGDLSAMAATCADQASIIDDFPPHVWIGAGACVRWADDFKEFVKQKQVTAPAVTIGKPWHVEVAGQLAYVAAPTTFSFIHKGKPVKENGVVTIALQKGAPGWRMIGWAWADH